MRTRCTLATLVIVIVSSTSCGQSNSDRTSRSAITPEEGAAPRRTSPRSLALDPATTATGLVLTTAGTPIAGASVDPEPLDGQPWPGFDSVRTTDVEGRYQLPLAAGRWDVKFAADGYNLKTLRIVVPRGDLVEINVTLRAVDTSGT